MNIKLLSDLLEEVGDFLSIREVVNCITLNKSFVNKHLSDSLLLRSSTAVLVLSGNARLCVNHIFYPVSSPSLLLLSASHLFSFDSCSDDFTAKALLVSREFTDSMDSTEMVYKRIRYEVMTFNRPVIPIEKVHALRLWERLKQIEYSIEDVTHKYYHEAILNAVYAFFLDSSNVIEQREDFSDEGAATRQESIIRSFVELLIQHYRTEHTVEFYASSLHLSSHYLTLLVKKVTGQSASDFIFEMLYSEARNLLAHSKLSVQEIADRLNFSDQSSFGKFFKRKSGVSPKDYRNG